MAEPSKLRQIFPKGTKAPAEKKTKSKIGDKGLMGYSLNQNDPETLKFIKDKHPITDHGDREDTGAFNVATDYCLDKPINKHLKGHGKDKERDVYEDQLDEKNWIAGAIKHPGAEKKAAKKAGMSTHGYMEKHKHDSGKSGDRARLGLTLSKMHKEEVEMCSKCHKDPCQCDKSQNEPAYKKDKKLLVDKKVKEETMANILAMEILEIQKIARFDEAQNLNPYAGDKIGGGGMGGGGFAPKPTSLKDITKAFSGRTPASQQSWWSKLKGDSPSVDNVLSANQNRAAASAGIKSQRDAYGRGTEKSFSDTHEPNPVDKGGEYKIGSGTYKSTLNPEGGKAIGKSVQKIDMGKPKFATKMKEDVKLCNKQDTHDTEFTKGMEVHKSAEGENQTTHKPDGPAANHTKKQVKTDTKVKKPFKEGSQAEPVTNRLIELTVKAIKESDIIHNKKIKEDIGAAAGTGSPSDRTQNVKADTTFALEGGKKSKRSPGTEKRMKLNDQIGRRQVHFGQNDEEINVS